MKISLYTIDKNILYISVVPEPPNNLTVVNKTADSILLYWSVPVPMKRFPPGLVTHIIYQSEYDDGWTVGYLSTSYLSLYTLLLNLLHQL